MQFNWLIFRSFSLSILLHMIVAGILLSSFNFSAKRPKIEKPNNVIKTIPIDKTIIKRKAETKQEKELQRQEKLKERVTELKKKREEEARKLAAIKKKREEEHRKKEEEKKKLESERKKKEDEKEKKRKEREKQLREQLKAEQQEEAQREKEKKRKKQLQEQLKAEQQEAVDLSEIQKYKILIGQTVEKYFNKLGLPEGLSCKVSIRLLEEGKVGVVSITESSGNDLFDKRAETAIYSASPLPVPTQKRIFEKMRTIEFEFKPKH